MSWNPLTALHPDEAGPEAIETVIVPRARDIGGFEVRRALPSARRQMVGPFIFFDEMGPAEFVTGRGLDVRPHPHIGLAIVTTCWTCWRAPSGAGIRPGRTGRSGRAR